jgi:hypothetical protein
LEVAVNALESLAYIIGNDGDQWISDEEAQEALQKIQAIAERKQTNDQ